MSKQDVSLLTLVGGEDVPSVNLFIEFFDLWLHNRVSSVRVNRVCLSFGMHLCGGLISVTSWSIDFLIGLPVSVPPDLPREDIRNLLSLNIIDVASLSQALLISRNSGRGLAWLVGRDKFIRQQISGLVVNFPLLDLLVLFLGVVRDQGHRAIDLLPVEDVVARLSLGFFILT